MTGLENVQEQILVTRSSMPSFEEYCEEIRPLWESHWLTNRGAKHNQLEKELSSYLGVRNLTLFVNGHQALESVFAALELRKDGHDEVITTPFTFASTTHAIVRAGLKPVFCDIKSDDLTLDPAKIEELITDRTCAIVPVHVYGNLCDVDAIGKIADRHDLKVVYDAAHAFGVERDGVGAAAFGDASMFSFHATKVFNTIEGGGISYANPALEERLIQWGNFGIEGPESVKYAGGNSKMNEFAAAMGICNLRHVNEEIAKRKLVAEHYWEQLEKIPGLKMPKPSANIKYNYAYMPVLIEPAEFGISRDDVFAALSEEGINARKYFYPLTSDFKCYEGMFAPGQKATPIAYDAANKVLTLPMYADLSLEDVDRICSIIWRVHDGR
ncbi:MAG: DegT/DnrJ/EryC1/StrS family aminotransferase [Eggerthella sp.]|nr:DegT/DnrJ/EryC1/StrS family aminotransferase [Eggerthella sp.]